MFTLNRNALISPEYEIRNTNYGLRTLELTQIQVQCPCRGKCLTFFRCLGINGLIVAFRSSRRSDTRRNSICNYFNCVKGRFIGWRMAKIFAQIAKSMQCYDPTKLLAFMLSHTLFSIPSDLRKNVIYKNDRHFYFAYFLSRRRCRGKQMLLPAGWLASLTAWLAGWLDGKML